jgi:hypothetical protein
MCSALSVNPVAQVGGLIAKRSATLLNPMIRGPEIHPVSARAVARAIAAETATTDTTCFTAHLARFDA